jgi:hypothetical protein
MGKFFAGFICGIVISTVGFGGVARMLDHGVEKVQDISKENAK